MDASADPLLCPACFQPTPGERCPRCDEAVWISDRLALVRPIEEATAGTFLGWLRDGAGRDEVAVKVLDIGGLRDWRQHDRFRRQTELLESLSHPRIPRPRGDFEVRSR